MTKILLVEDDKSLREIYGVRLLAEGYDIVSAGDGEEALAMAIKERPALIVSDVMMPKISGFDMLDILRSATETKDIKVIMMTALSSDDQRARGEQLGADRYLVKSQVGIEDVVRTVHEVLGDLPGMTPAAPATPASEPTVPAPIPQPTPVVPPAPVAAPIPEPTPVPEPVTPAPSFNIPTRPDVASLSPQPNAPAPQPVAPTPPVTQPITPEAVAPVTTEAQVAPQPAVAPAPQPASNLPQPGSVNPLAAPAPQSAPQSAPQADNLPQPTAPFSSSAPRPANLGDRVIHPLEDVSLTPMQDMSKLIEQELTNQTQPMVAPTPEAATFPPIPELPVAPTADATQSSINPQSETPQYPQPPVPPVQ